MNQAAWGVLAAGTLLASGCAAPVAGPAASGTEPGVQQATATVAASPETSGPLAGPPSGLPSSGLPSSGLPVPDFCAAGEIYLARFPGLSRYEPESEAPEPQNSSGCAYSEAAGDETRPFAVLTFAELSEADEIQALLTASCTYSALAPGVTHVEALARERGWSAWTATEKAGVYEAQVCTGSHMYNASLGNVPGTMPEDALKIILAVIR